MPAPPVIALRGLSKRYGDVVALEGLDLELAAGECVALIGHNGSGKTTTMRLAAGQLEPTSGTVRVAGVDVHSAPDAHRARAALAFVPDSPLLYDDLTVAEHLELVGLAHGVGETLDDRIDLLLDVLELRGRRDFLPVQLSRGMRQKTQLACTFVRPFQALLLDEPVVGLDPPSQANLRELLEEAKSEGIAILLSTHQLRFSAGLADRAVVLHDGRVIDAGDYEGVVDGEDAARLGLR
jgi:ABC-2 type transport system ATP-binding protein